ncbi:MGMT family protein [Lacrimispora saccharolytica]|uniref:Methylated-DNA-(Protein)-cysteine S-methyltransferase DNA binding protein n=1 Tax=Lacrimispora saccharolytica (strain ATCC 35040 / DSM 2544 / NRCC 2533 / WM1) TaxID=610130 RepID=D9R5R4_LACSW|nr:MGMT family protein [Lacrimispora saccharolytica]ADL05247.1 Methylated-DNA-(protein)-cysteine S-methyltransferase DNA binding protein [[Clostridium] saccharolyticum WM1]QRV20577.1 MGMT family protein [Lacrimispora saccharolytica]
MTLFTEEVLVIIKGIPYGRVMSYGQVARLAGNTRGARQVVRILHSMSEKYKLPWHRIINSKGKISITDKRYAAIQRELLISEGVEVFEDGSVNISTYGM